METWTETRTIDQILTDRILKKQRAQLESEQETQAALALAKREFTRETFFDQDILKKYLAYLSPKRIDVPRSLRNYVGETILETVSQVVPREHVGLYEDNDMLTFLTRSSLCDASDFLKKIAEVLPNRSVICYLVVADSLSEISLKPHASKIDAYLVKYDEKCFIVANDHEDGWVFGKNWHFQDWLDHNSR